MQATDAPAFTKALAACAALYEKSLSEEVIAIWWAAMRKYDLLRVRTALSKHAMHPEAGRFMPKPADIIRELEGTYGQRAQIAWGKVREALGSVGAYHDVVFDDEVIHSVIDDLGGWPKLCRQDSKELGYSQHRFCESYEAYVTRGDGVYPRRLMGDGCSEDRWAMRGLPPPEPVFVGDPERCREVFEGGQRGGKVRIASAPLGLLSGSNTTNSSLQPIAGLLAKKLEK